MWPLKEEKAAKPAADNELIKEYAYRLIRARSAYHEAVKNLEDKFGDEEKVFLQWAKDGKLYQVDFYSAREYSLPLRVNVSELD